MSHRKSSRHGYAWGGLFVLVSSAALAACDGGDGDGAGCPQVAGQWSLSGTCELSSCTITQTGCQLELECDGLMGTGTVGAQSVSFRDETGRCTGTLGDLVDEDGDGFISPTLSGTCRPLEGGESCDYAADCASGECTIAPQEDADGGEAGRGGSGGGGGGGTGGSSEVDGTGAIDPEVCSECVLSACEAASTTCAQEGDCASIVDCAVAIQTLRQRDRGRGRVAPRDELRLGLRRKTVELRLRIRRFGVRIFLICTALQETPCLLMPCRSSLMGRFLKQRKEPSVYGSDQTGRREHHTHC